jgi:hypothetical protein
VSERFDRAELAAAQRLNEAVDEALAGRTTPDVDPSTGALVRMLVDAGRAEPPAALAARVASTVRRAERRLWRPAQLAAAALGFAFLFQGIGSLTSGRWVARHLDTPFDAHTFFEGGVVLLALGGVLLAAAVARRWIDLAVAAGVPVGVAFAIHGLPELSEFPAGGALHLTQGVFALALGLLWWRARSYVLAAREERA